MKTYKVKYSMLATWEREVKADDRDELIESMWTEDWVFVEEPTEWSNFNVDSVRAVK